MGKKQFDIFKKLNLPVVVVMVGLIGIFDYLTGYDISPTILYLVPIILVTLNMGLYAGVLISILSAVVWAIAEAGHPNIPPYIILWNSMVSLGIFLVITLTFSKLKQTLDIEKNQREHLEELNQQKNRLLGIAAHDLRNPIGSIKLYSSFILEDMSEGDSEKLKENLQFLKVINQTSNYMLRLVDDMLDYSTIESGHLQLELTKNDYLAFIKDNMKRIKIFAETKDITINLIVDGKIPELYFDKNRMSQAFMNLVMNAISYSKPKSTIDVTIENNSNSVITRITDHGIGIPKDELALIFKEFQRGSVKTTKGEKSTGLGLAIAKKIIESHKGKINVDSEPRKGTTFYYNLPISSDLMNGNRGYSINL